MAAQIRKKKIRHIFFAFLNAYYTKTHLIKSSNFLNSSRPYGRLLENQKTGGSRELFLISKTAPQKFFFKRHSDFGGLETNQKHDIQI